MVSLGNIGRTNRREMTGMGSRANCLCYVNDTIHRPEGSCTDREQRTTRMLTRNRPRSSHRLAPSPTTFPFKRSTNRVPYKSATKSHLPVSSSEFVLRRTISSYCFVIAPCKSKHACSSFDHHRAFDGKLRTTNSLAPEDGARHGL